MKIGIDARLIGETGVGRYIRNLISTLAVIDRKNSYVLFLKASDFHTFHPPNSRWTKCKANVPWHSLREQVVMPGIFTRQKLDILHVPYFNAPLFYGGKMVLTIHDLIINHTDTGRASKLPWIFYQLRRFGYFLVTQIGVRRARRVITVSAVVKKDIEKELGVAPEKITVTYEGVDPKTTKTVHKKRLIEAPYFLYVGNAYPHKNLETLLDAYALYKKSHEPAARLVLVGKNDYFYQRLQAYASNLGLAGDIDFLGAVSDSDLQNLYAGANVFVYPSHMEGFGLPPLEALANDTPVVCSDIPVFHEILDGCATFVDTTHAATIAAVLAKYHAKQEASDAQKRQYRALVAKYDWTTMAKQTLAIYEQADGVS